jgi:hypothetical protein
MGWVLLDLTDHMGLWDKIESEAVLFLQLLFSFMTPTFFLLAIWQLLLARVMEIFVD